MFVAILAVPLACAPRPASTTAVRAPTRALLAQSASSGTDASGSGILGRRPRVSLTQRFLDATGLSNVLPRTSTGTISLLQIANIRLEINPSLHDPLTALGACADLVTDCYHPPNVSLDQCMTSAASCRTAEPWNETACCPTACRDSYQRARQSGVAPTAALDRVFFQQPDCFPGVHAMIARQP